MTNEQFIDRLMNAVPDAKDIARAKKIVDTCYFDYDRTSKAKLQLQKITDVSKMFRRAKAFINNGIEINFGGSKIFRKWIMAMLTDRLKIGFRLSDVVERILHQVY